MPSPLPPSLGDEKVVQDWVLTRVEVPRPSGRKELVAAFENIVNAGKVQKIVVELGKPIIVSKYVPKGEQNMPEEIPESDPYAAIRNAEMKEFLPTKNESLHEYLFKAFHLLSQRKVRPQNFLVRSFGLLREALEVDEMWDLTEMFGVPVLAVPDLPEDTLLLSSSKVGEDVVALTLRLVFPGAL